MKNLKQEDFSKIKSETCEGCFFDEGLFKCSKPDHFDKCDGKKAVIYVKKQPEEITIQQAIDEILESYPVKRTDISYSFIQHILESFDKNYIIRRK